MPTLSLPESAAASRQIWSRLTASQRLALVACALAVVGGVVGFVAYAQRSRYQTLYTGLAGDDSTAVRARLGALGIPHEVAEGGATVRVAADRLDEARLGLAAEGLPASGTLGFELFDRNQLGATDFTENVNLRRALEGELARTVRSLKEVAAARVHVTLPRERPFARGPGEAKASVVLKLRAGRRLEPSQVEAIQQLVASAVEGLKPASVVVVDDRGSLLTRAEAGPAAGLLSRAEQDEKRRIEEELGEKVLAILQPVFGMGKVFARVTAELDFSATEETAEIFAPEGRAVRSEQRAEERSRATAAAGVPGVASNVTDPAAPAGPAPAAPVVSPPEKLSETRNYEVSRTTRRTSRPSGQLRRLSVAVVVDGRAPASEPAGAGGEPGAPDLARIEGLVQAAVGFEPGRGDRLEVEILPFEAAAPDLAADPPAVSRREQAEDLLRSHGRAAGLALAALAAYLLFVRPLQREALSALRSVRALPAATAEQPPAEARAPAEALAARAEAAALVPAAPALPAEVRQAVAQAVGADPAATARFLRSWLEREAR